MKHIAPRIFKDEISFINSKIIRELKTIIMRMKELDLEDRGYKFHTENGDEVIIREVLIEEDGVLSFAVEEYYDDNDGATFTIIAEEIPIDNLLKLYQEYYANNINTLMAV